MKEPRASNRYLDVTATEETVSAYWASIEREMCARARRRSRLRTGTAVALVAALFAGSLSLNDWARRGSVEDPVRPESWRPAKPSRSDLPAVRAPRPHAPAGRPKLVPYARLPKSFFEMREHRRYQQAFMIAESMGEARLASLAPEDLLAVAEVARVAGKLTFSERTYRVLLERHRGDAQAARGWLELGRLLLNDSNEPGGAVRAFNQALLVEPNSDEAEALRVRALDRSRDPSSCIEARERFLRRNPYSPYSAGVEAACR